MKYKILTTNRGRWGEGWQNGDIVEMDAAAADVPLMNGEIEPYVEEVAPEIQKEAKEAAEKAFEFQCECGKVCKNKAGLAAHKRSCKA